MTDSVSSLKTIASDLAMVVLRRATIFGVIGASVLVAVGFGTAAIWTLIADALGPAAASGFIAAGYLVFAGILVLVVRRRRRKVPQTPETPQAPSIFPALAQTFVTCIHLGRQAGASRR